MFFEAASELPITMLYSGEEAQELDRIGPLQLQYEEPTEILFIVD